jgi:hypothetical protein
MKGLQNLDELKKEQAEKLEKATAIQIMFNKIAENLPSFYAPTKICEHVCYADAFIEIEAETLQAAMEVMEKSNPLAMYRYMDGCLSFRSEKGLQEKSNGRLPDKDKAELIAPYRYKVQKMRQYHQEQALIWYIQAGQFVVEVRCSVQKPKCRIDCKITFDRYGNARKHYCNLVGENSGYFTKSDKFYSSQEHPNSFVLWTN